MGNSSLRLGEVALTRDMQRKLEEQWPALATQLRSFLARRGTPYSRREDIVQETAARLVSMWERVDQQRPAWPLVKTIALNLIRDEARKRLEEIPTEELEMPSLDHEASMMARLELSRVRVALGVLPDSQRGALLAEMGEVSSTRTDADKMLRLRARKRLRQLMQELPAMLPWRSKGLESGFMGMLGEAALPGLACIACLGIYSGGLAVRPLAPVPSQIQRHAHHVEVSFPELFAGVRSLDAASESRAARSAVEALSDANTAPSTGSRDQTPSDQALVPDVPGSPVETTPVDTDQAVDVPTQTPGGGIVPERGGSDAVTRIIELVEDELPIL
jgi:DNA-directed RNA polymerase specialized sigma24 family protein